MTQTGTATITVAQAAQLLMITEQWVRDLSRKGYIPRPEGSKVPLVGAVQGYIRWLKDEERRTSKTASQSAVQQARAREIELRIARESGRLLDLEDVETTFATILGIYRAELAGVAAASTRDLVLRETIDRALNDAVARARDRFRRHIEALRAGRDIGVDDPAPIPG